MSLRCHLFVSDMNEGYEDFACKKVGSRFTFVTLGTDRFSLDLPRAAKNNVPWKWNVGAVWNSRSQTDLS